MKSKSEIQEQLEMIKKAIALGEISKGGRFNYESFEGIKGAEEAIERFLNGESFRKIKESYPNGGLFEDEDDYDPFENGAYEAINWIMEVHSDPPISPEDIADRKKH